jgi:predicted RNase H-like HicB family nuclease
MQYRVNIVLNKDKHGYFVHCPELPGCHSQGDTFEEAMSNIKEAVELYLETMTPAEIKEALSKEIVKTTMEVKVA